MRPIDNGRLILEEFPMTRLNDYVTIVLMAVLLVLPRLAAAENTTPATAYIGVLGQLRSEALSEVGVAGDVGYYRYTLTANRSYYAVCWHPFVEGNSGTAQPCFLQWHDANDVDLPHTGFFIEPFSIGFYAQGKSFSPTVNGEYYVRIRNGNAAVTPTDLVVIETTLFSPWYFLAPASGYETYIEVRNNTRETFDVTIRAYAPSGILVRTLVVSIPGNGNTAIRVNADMGVPNGSGSLSISYDAPPGAISANGTTLSAMTGLSFDAPFTPRMSWGTFSR
jgi:hypothetical protein